MILTGQEIKKQVDLKHITIDPFDDSCINPNSYNYHLGSVIFEIAEEIIEPRKKAKYRIINLDDDGYVLKPGKLYLASTFEQIGSDKFVTSLIGRSSVGRLGLFLQITADLGNLGAKHHWTLELKVVQPLRVYPNMKVGQVSFWVADGAPSMQYDGKYKLQTGPHNSKIYEELDHLNEERKK